MADVTDLLNRWSAGDESAFDAAVELLYAELRVIAKSLMRREKPGHVLQTTALVHEAYLRLIGQTKIDWRGRAHFLGAAARAMRRILVDQARRRLAIKRGSGIHPEDLDLSLAIALGPDVEVMDLNEALNELATFDPDRARVVELRYFGGLSLEETAEVLEISPQAVSRDWSVARAWLARRIKAPAAVLPME